MRSLLLCCLAVLFASPLLGRDSCSGGACRPSPPRPTVRPIVGPLYGTYSVSDSGIRFTLFNNSNLDYRDLYIRSEQAILGPLHLRRGSSFSNFLPGGRRAPLVVHQGRFLPIQWQRQSGGQRRERPVREEFRSSLTREEFTNLIRRADGDNRAGRRPDSLEHFIGTNYNDHRFGFRIQEIQEFDDGLMLRVTKGVAGTIHEVVLLVPQGTTPYKVGDIIGVEGIIISISPYVGMQVVRGRRHPIGRLTLRAISPPRVWTEREIRLNRPRN